LTEDTMPDTVHDCRGSLVGATPVTTCDAQLLRQLVEAGTSWLERHTAAINSLNVFPVPDGDTGTNMVLTMRSALLELNQAPQESAGAVAHTISHGALMGARGNSGVILSQLLRGLAKGLDHKDTFNAKDFAGAWVEASATAYKAVMKPVEGTILTVSKDVAAAAVSAAAEMEDLVYVFCRIVEEARRSVARTPSLLPVLQEAGVVDAGGQGLLTVLEGMMRFIRGETYDVMTAVHTPHMTLAQSLEYGYEVQFVLQGSSLDLESIRETINRMGESTLVVGDSETIKVHVHTPEPGAPLTYAVQLGSLSQVSVENLSLQAAKFMSTDRAGIAKALEHTAKIAVVVVSPGAGLTRVFESLGASAVVAGGQTMNPSTEELLRAVEKLTADEVIILPNNDNILLTARQVGGLTHKTVRVVGSRTTPQGIGALLAFNYQADLETNVGIMEQAAKNVRTVEVTTAVRSAQLNGLRVEQGEVIALCDGNLVVSGHDIPAVVKEALAQAGIEESEIITLYYGDNTTKGNAESLVNDLLALYPGLEFELVEGGQPHYHYIISLE
jgi:DAK2 domain fusion protein YloV